MLERAIRRTPQVAIGLRRKGKSLKSRERSLPSLGIQAKLRQFSRVTKHDMIASVRFSVVLSQHFEPRVASDGAVLHLASAILHSPSPCSRASRAELAGLHLRSIGILSPYDTDLLCGQSRCESLQRSADELS